MSLDEATDYLLASSRSPEAEFHAWKRGMTEWMPAKQIEELQRALANKLSPSQANQNSAPEILLDSEPSIRLESLPSEAPTVLNASPLAEKPQAPVRSPLPYYALIGACALAAGGYFLWPQLMQPQGLIHRWLTRLPEIQDVPLEQKNLLQAAASSGSADPASAPVEMAMTTASNQAQSPIFYLASNLPDGAELTLEIQADPTRVAGLVSSVIRTTATIQHRLARTEAIKANDGNVLPRGEYQVAVLDPDHHTRLSRRIFIGGESLDANFTQELGRYQQGIIVQAQAEISDLKNVALKLDLIQNGQENLIRQLKKLRNAAAQEKAKAATEKQRLVTEDEIEKLLQPNVHFFPVTRNAALALHDAIEELRVNTAPTTDPSRQEAAKKISALQSDLAAKIEAAEKRIQSTTGYFAPEKQA